MVTTIIVLSDMARQQASDLWQAGRSNSGRTPLNW